jgi:hypothetical protein
MMERKTLEKLFAVVGQLDEHLAPIVSGPQAAKKSPIDEAVDQLDRAVML